MSSPCILDLNTVPVVYLHPPPAFRDGRAAYVATDNEADAWRETAAAMYQRRIRRP